jgi:hypothetical protein
LFWFFRGDEIDLVDGAIKLSFCAGGGDDPAKEAGYKQMDREGYAYPLIYLIALV